MKSILVNYGEVLIYPAHSLVVRNEHNAKKIMIGIFLLATYYFLVGYIIIFLRIKGQILDLICCIL